MNVDEKIDLIVQQCQQRIMKLTGKPATLILCGNKNDMIIKYDDVVKAVCEVTEVPYERALLKSRKREVVIVRQLIFFYAHLYGKLSHGTIASELGYKEHSTSIHSIQKIRDLIDAKDLTVTCAIKRINKQLNITT